MRPQSLRSMINQARLLIASAALVAAGCANQMTSTGQGDCSALAGCPVCPMCPAPSTTAPRINPLEPVDFAAVTGWKNGEQAAAWPALLASCQALRWREGWRGVCAKAMELRSPTDEDARRFLEEQFVPWRLANPDGSLDGLVTGYYEPVLRGSRTKLTPFVYPLYGPPDDLLTIDLSATNPELRGMRLRGRVEGKRIVPVLLARGNRPRHCAGRRQGNPLGRRSDRGVLPPGAGVRSGAARRAARLCGSATQTRTASPSSRSDGFSSIGASLSSGKPRCSPSRPGRPPTRSG